MLNSILDESIEVEIGGVNDGEIRLKVTPEVEITSRLESFNPCWECYQLIVPINLAQKRGWGDTRYKKLFL